MSVTIPRSGRAFRSSIKNNFDDHTVARQSQTDYYAHEHFKHGDEFDETKLNVFGHHCSSLCLLKEGTVPTVQCLTA